MSDEGIGDFKTTLTPPKAMRHDPSELERRIDNLNQRLRVIEAALAERRSQNALAIELFNERLTCVETAIKDLQTKS